MSTLGWLSLSEAGGTEEEERRREGGMQERRRKEENRERGRKVGGRGEKEEGWKEKKEDGGRMEAAGREEWTKGGRGGVHLARTSLRGLICRRREEGETAEASTARLCMGSLASPPTHTHTHNPKSKSGHF